MVFVAPSTRDREHFPRGWCVHGRGGAACRRRGCSGSPSFACFSSGTLNLLWRTVLLLSCALCVFLLLSAMYILGDKLIAAGCCVLALRLICQYLRFLRSREPSTRTLCPSSRIGTPRTRTPAPGPVWGARRSTTAWSRCKNHKNCPLDLVLIPCLLLCFLPRIA